MGDFLRQIIVLCMGASAAEMLLPKGRTRDTARLGLSLCVLLCTLRAIRRLIQG